ncbi:hypothetical protein [Streptomyces cucumeris]|uniref:hypothetical protein n=1 Tax=Streptomyces cucumeris TaxID=2962890 RepID=UPI003D741B11
MGLFSRKTSPAPENPAMTELGREFANAKRHGDRKAMRQIARTFSQTSNGDTDAAAFEKGKRAYEDIPPAYFKPRRSRRR